MEREREKKREYEVIRKRRKAPKRKSSRISGKWEVQKRENKNGERKGKRTK